MPIFGIAHGDQSCAMQASVDPVGELARNLVWPIAKDVGIVEGAILIAQRKSLRIAGDTLTATGIEPYLLMQG